MGEVDWFTVNCRDGFTLVDLITSIVQFVDFSTDQLSGE